MKLYIQIRGKAQGPCPVEEVRSLLANGWLSPSDLGQYEGESQWQPLSSFPELKLESEPEAQPSSEPASEPVLEEVVSKPVRRPKIAVRIPWRPILKGVFLLAAVGGIGYGAVLLLQKLKSDPPRFLTRIRQSLKREGKVVAIEDAKTNATTTVAMTTNPVVTSATPIPETASTSPSPVISALTTNRPQAVALIDAGVLQDSPATADLIATARPTIASVTNLESRRRTISAADLDPKMTPFGSYDVTMIQSIQKRWLQILNEQNVAQGRSGRVVIEFKLSFQGRTSDMRVAETTSEEILAYLCEKAIRESEPFNPWPAELRKLVKGDNRLMRFTFYY